MVYLQRNVVYFECVLKYTSKVKNDNFKFYKDDFSVLRVWRAPLPPNKYSVTFEVENDDFGFYKNYSSLLIVWRATHNKYIAFK